jgi:arginine N-succinyltransferase
MYVVRPSTIEDASGIESVIRDNHARISSLPRKREKLLERIEHSMTSFATKACLQGEEFFLFVMEESETGEIVGCSAISVNNDPQRPFYNYRQDELIHASETFDIHTTVPILYLTHELTGKTVLSSFAIQDKLLKTPYFDLMSRARLMFLRQFTQCFSSEVIVELQGVTNEEDESPFWDSLGRQFFNMDYVMAGYHVATKSRTMLAEMMPPHPIYVTMLTPQAQAVMGKTDERAKATHKLLEKEGFEASPYIDIFDGGPVLMAKTNETHTFQHSRFKQVKGGKVTTGPLHLVANKSFSDFRCLLAQITDGMGEVVRLDGSILTALNVRQDDEIFYLHLTK